ncbi:hypothetical protein VE25_07455 [Devosia geojensis]|uniref:Uncharacterized protein n=1 Tax=Devosia geojensis TaxID=443610 RepID=A0A0F5FU27_9HYPH|nr:hypothetical protein VE25_07455 [Devosia geojensis]
MAGQSAYQFAALAVCAGGLASAGFLHFAPSEEDSMFIMIVCHRGAPEHSGDHDALQAQGSEIHAGGLPAL